MRRIQRSADKEEVINALTKGENPCFKEIWRLLIFAAFLGFKHDRAEPLGKFDSGKGIDESYLGNSPAWPGMLYLLGIVKTNDASVLFSSEQVENTRAELFETYANGGLAILKDRLEASSYSLDAILALIGEESVAVLSQKPSLENVTI